MGSEMAGKGKAKHLDLGKGEEERSGSEGNRENTFQNRHRGRSGKEMKKGKGS